MSDPAVLRYWDTYAHRFLTPDGEIGYAHFVSKEKIHFYGSKNEVVAVRLHEDPEGTYMGWIPTGWTNRIVNVERAFIFDISFIYGYRVEQAAGKGQAVHLRVEEREDTEEAGREEGE